MILLAALVFAAADPAPIVTRDISITIPGPLDGAVAPYRRCVVAALNSGVKEIGGAPEVHAKLRDHVMSKCRETRMRAFRAADGVAQRYARDLNTEERATMIEAVLKSLDSLVELATSSASASTPDTRDSDAQD